MKLRTYEKLGRKVNSGRAFLDVVRNDIILAEPDHISRGIFTTDNYQICPSSIGYLFEEKKVIGPDLTFSIENYLRSAFFSGNNNDERNLVFGVSSQFATGSLPVQIGINGLYGTLQRIECFTLQHEIVMDAQRCGISDTVLVTQRQSGQSDFRLIAQIIRQKPDGQRQKLFLKNCPDNKLIMVVAMAIRKYLWKPLFRVIIPQTFNLWAMNSVWSAVRFQCRSSLSHITKTLVEFGERIFFLKLLAVHRPTAPHCN